MVIDEDIYLEHFGVKGMQWGVRKSNTSSSGKTSSDNKTSKKKRAAQIAVVTGVVVAGAIIAHRSGFRMSSLRSTASTGTGRKATSDVLARAGKRSANLFGSAPRKPGAIPLGPSGAPTTVRAIPLGPSRAAKVGERASNLLTNQAVKVGGRASNRSKAPSAADLRASIAKNIREANAELRSRDNDLNIPLKDRVYLPEWD